jgi:hypothetical protein
LKLKTLSMSTKLFVTIAGCFVLLLGFLGILLNGKGSHQLSLNPVDENGVAVVELFTSEGCSSCPPADQLLSDLKIRMAGKNVFLLALHVDYWNYLGWKDHFGEATYSERQRKYASVLRSEVYTPQMIVNGKSVFVGSDRSQANEAISEALKNPAATLIKIQNDFEKDRKRVKVQFIITGDITDEVLNIALVQQDAATSVLKGENEGRKLNHVNVVRSFVSIPASHDGAEEISFPSELENQTATIICFTQDKNTLAVSGAAMQDVVLAAGN